MEKPVKVVSFDLWQTLIKGVPGGKSRADLLFETLQPMLPFEDFEQLLKQVDHDIDIQSETNGKSYGPWERLDELCDRLTMERLTQEQKQAFYDDRTRQLLNYPPMLLDPETIPLLHELSLRYKLAITSNTGFINGQEMRAALDKIGVLGYFTFQLFSNELDVCKPDPQIYQELVRQAMVEPYEIVHIGDNPVADVQGAQQAGLQALHRPKDIPLRSVLAPLLTELGA